MSLPDRNANRSFTNNQRQQQQQGNQLPRRSTNRSFSRTSSSGESNGFTSKKRIVLLAVGLGFGVLQILFSLRFTTTTIAAGGTAGIISAEDSGAPTTIATIATDETVNLSRRLSIEPTTPTTTTTERVVETQAVSTTRQQQQQQQQQPCKKDENSSDGTTSGSSSPYAYMFVLGGIHEDRPSYKGFVYDVLIAVSQLHKLGSTADVVLWYQLSSDSSRTTLPDEDERLLTALNVQLRPLPKPTGKESFASLVFEKFRALQMTEYRRVVFLDADAIPLANLDYLFHLSDPLHTATPTLLKPNLILASRGEACNAGMFMLEPRQGDWEELQTIVRNQRLEGARLPYPHFSWERGWGYNFLAENDKWRGTAKWGQKWRFHAGHSDQGLLYYWTKFVKRRVSIVVQDEIENWIDPIAQFGGAEEGNSSRLRRQNIPTTIDGKPKPILETTLTQEPLLAYSSEHPTAYQFSCNTSGEQAKDRKQKPFQCLVPYRDFAHFMGGSKPWQIDNNTKPTQFIKRITATRNTQKYNAPTALWFEEFQYLATKLEMKIDLDTDLLLMFRDKATPLGAMAKHYDFLGDQKRN